MATEDIGIKISVDGTRTVERDLDTLANSARVTGNAIGQLKKALNELERLRVPGNLKSEIDKIAVSLNSLKSIKGGTSSIFAGIGQGAATIKAASADVNKLATGFANLEIATGTSIPRAVTSITRLRNEINKAATVLANKEIAALPTALAGALSRAVPPAQELKSALQQTVSSTINAGTAFQNFSSKLTSADSIKAARDHVDRLATGFAKMELTTGRALPSAVAHISQLRNEINRVATGFAEKEIAALGRSTAALNGPVIQAGTAFQNFSSKLTSADAIRAARAHVDRLAMGFAQMELTTGRALPSAVAHINQLRNEINRVATGMASKEIAALGQSVIQTGSAYKNYINTVSSANGPMWHQVGIFQQLTGSMSPVAAAAQTAGAATQTAAQGVKRYSNILGTLKEPLTLINVAHLKLAERLKDYYAVMGRGYIPMSQQLSAFKTTRLAVGDLHLGMGNLISRIFTFRNALILLFSQMALHSLRKYIDQWIGYENNIRLSTKSTEEAAVVEEALFAVAQKTRMSMETAIPLYRRLAQAQVDLGATQRQMIDLTRGVGMALAIQGVSADSARGALLQLGQLLGMARVRAQEFNSINENTPRILQAVADGVKGAGGSIHVLRQMVIKGTVTNKDFFDAILKALPQLEAEFARVTPTIGQAFTVLENAMGRYIRTIDKATGGSRAFAESIIWLGNNLNSVIGALESVVAGFVVLAAPWLWAKIAAGFAALMAASGPAGWAVLTVAALVAAGVALLNFGDKLTLTTVKYNAWRDTVNKPLKTNNDPVMLTADWKPIDISVLDYVKGIWDEIKLQFTSGLNWIKNIFLELTRVIVNFVGPILGFFVESWGDAFRRAGISTETLSTSFGDVFDAVLGWADKVLGVFTGLWDAAAQMVGGLTPLLKSIFTGENILDSMKTYGSSIGKAYVDGFNSQFKGAKGPLAQALARIQAGAEKSAIARQPARGVANLDDPPGKRPSQPVDVSKQQKAYDHLLSSLDPVHAAIMHIVDGNKVLNNAFQAGLITLQEYDSAYELLTQKYEDGLHPIKATIRELQEEILMMGESVLERRGGVEMMQIEQRYRKMNMRLSDEERFTIEKLVTEKQRLKFEQQELEKYYNKFTRPLQEYEAALAVVEKAMKKYSITTGEARQHIAELAMAAGRGNFYQGFIVGLKVLDRQTTNWIGRLGQMMGEMVDTFASGIGDAFGRMIVYGESFRDIIGDISRQILSSLISALIKMGIQLGINELMTLGSQATLTAGAVATGAAITAAATPAAMAMSIATEGAAAVIGEAAFTQAMLTAQVMAVVPFSRGGYTGGGRRDEMAGVVHGQEFVVNADGTRRNRALLESINRGGTPGTPQRSSMPGGAPVVNISVQNHSTAGIEVQQISPTDIRIIARQEARRAVEQDSPRVVAAQMRDANSRISKSMEQSTRTTRRR